MATFRHRLQRYIRDFVTLVTAIMIHDLFDDDPSFELVGVLRGTRRVCVTIQDCVISTENLKRERECECTVVQISKCVQWYKDIHASPFGKNQREGKKTTPINLPSLKRSSAKGTGRQRVRCALRILCLLFKEHYS